MPNAILTLKEYLLDYASIETRKIGESAIEKYVNRLDNIKTKQFVLQGLNRLEKGERDIRV